MLKLLVTICHVYSMFLKNARFIPVLMFHITNTPEALLDSNLNVVIFLFSFFFFHLMKINVSNAF